MTDELPLVDEAVVYEAVTEAYAPATKTAMDGLDVVWSADDQIAVFQGNISYDVFGVTSASVGKTEAAFTLKTDNEDNMQTLPFNLAVYPITQDFEAFYDDETSFGVWGLELPSTQKYAAGSFGNGAFPMAAVSEDNKFEFKNLLGAMKLQLKGDRAVKSITVTDNAGNQLAGLGGVYMSVDDVPAFEFQMSYPGQAVPNSVTLDCGEGVELNKTTATEFVIALPETDFAEGFTVMLTDTEGNVLKFQSKASEKNYIERSTILVMPELDLESLTQDVEFKAVPSMSDAEINIKVNVEGVEGFYGIFVRKEMWPEIEMYLEYGYFTFSQILQGMMGTEMPCRFYGKEYTGKLSEFGLSDDYLVESEYNDFTRYTNMIQPNSSYYVVVVPGNELPTAGGGAEDDLGGGVAPLNLDEDGDASSETYTLDDAILFEVSTTGFTTGGTVELPSYEIVEGYTSSVVTFDPSEDVAYMMYAVYEAGSVLPTASNYIDALTDDAYYSPIWGAEVMIENSYGYVPGTEYVLCVLVADAQGKTSYYTIDVATTPIPFKESLTVNISNAEYDSEDDCIYADVEYSSETVKLYYNVSTQKSYAANSYSEATFVLDIVNDVLYYFKEIDLSTAVDNTLEISVPAPKTNNYVHLVAVDAEGNVSHITSSVNCPKK